MTNEQDWPAGRTARERVETVVQDRISADVCLSIPMIADEAGVDVDTARSVVHDMATRGTVEVVGINDKEWISRRVDYSDSRWKPVDGDA